jgi:molybdenum-dependent DNA-binding transcriptional regulator ModE
MAILLYLRVDFPNVCAIDTDLVSLLEAIDAVGSLTGADRTPPMSYRHGGGGAKLS